MNKFSAGGFYSIAAFFESVSGIIASIKEEVPEEGRVRVKHTLTGVAESCDAIALTQSAAATRRLLREWDEHMTSEALRANLRSVTQLIYSEMETQLFFWVPVHRAEWYGKDAEAILGAECASRFGSIHREVEEAAKCFAFGRHTSSAFHLCRATEAGLKAISKAINFVPANDNWTLVFRELGRQSKLDPKLRPAPWPTHEKFLDLVCGDLKAVSKAWRNDICHLVDTYGENEAKDMLTVIPMFLRDLATQIDENGILY